MLTRFIVAVMALLAGCTLLACSGGESRVLNILYWQAPSVSVPYQSSAFKDRDAGAVTLEPLALYEPDGSLAPVLAVEIPTIENGGVAPDQRSITWTLHSGVKWSDGSELTAEDVVFTWRYCTDEATGCTAADLFTGVESVEALDAHTIRIHFDAPTPYPYQAFVTTAAPIISRIQFAECVGSDARSCEQEHTKPVGTGPYRIISFTPEREVVYERNPHFRGEQPYFDRVVITGGGDAEDAAQAVLQLGTADYAWNLQVEPDLLRELEEAGHGTVISAFSDLVERIVFNQTNPDPELGADRSEYLDGSNPHPFLTIPAIRQAMSLAIDRSQIAALYGFAGQPECNLVAGPEQYRSAANDDCLGQDIDDARRLLDRHQVLDTDGDGIREHQGVPLRIVYMTSTNSIRQATQELIRDWWRAIGIETILVDYDASDYFGGDPVEHADRSYRRFFADVQMYATGGGIEPQAHLLEHRCDQIPTRNNYWGAGNHARACNVEYDSVFELLRLASPGRDRDALVKRLNDILVQSYVQIPLVRRGIVSAHAQTLQGVDLNPWDSELWNIAEWRR